MSAGEVPIQASIGLMKAAEGDVLTIRVISATATQQVASLTSSASISSRSFRRA